MKEFFRKRIVALKRGPQIIPLLLLIVSCCLFLFALGNHSDASRSLITINDINAATGRIKLVYAAPGLFLFISTLLSVLSVISYLSVYKKGKTNYFMLGVEFLMLAVIIVSNILYINSLKYLTFEFPVLQRMMAMEKELGEGAKVTYEVVSQTSSEIVVKIIGTLDGATFTSEYASAIKDETIASVSNATTFIIMTAITAFFMAILPLIKKALNLIDTSVEDDYDKLMEQKSEDELLLDLEEVDTDDPSRTKRRIY